LTGEWRIVHNMSLIICSVVQKNEMGGTCHRFKEDDHIQNFRKKKPEVKSHLRLLDVDWL